MSRGDPRGGAAQRGGAPTGGGGGGASSVAGESSAPYGGGYIGVSLSCDGRTWAPLTVLTTCSVAQGRARDHPVDGLLIERRQGRDSKRRSGDAVDGIAAGAAVSAAGNEVDVFALVHKDVPMRGFVDAAAHSGETTRLVMHALNRTTLRALTIAARASLPGCNEGT